MDHAMALECISKTTEDLKKHLEEKGSFLRINVDFLLNHKGTIEVPLEINRYLLGVFTRNSLYDLQSYFSTPEKPVEYEEMMDFWMSLSINEKLYYKLLKLV